MLIGLETPLSDVKREAVMCYIRDGSFERAVGGVVTTTRVQSHEVLLKDGLYEHEMSST